MTAPALSRPRWRALAVSFDPVVAVLAAVAALAAGLWATSLDEVDLQAMNDLGLISVLPAPALAGMAILSLSFAASLALRRLSTPLIVLHLVILLVMIYGLPALVEPLPRFNVSWRHVGIAEVLSRTGVIDANINAYFNWPGFFALSAFVSGGLGLPDAVPLLAWAPLAFNALYLPPLLLVFRSLTPDRRVAWLSVWIFFVANWIGQDYYSPQAFAYLLMLWVIALVLRWFTVRSAGVWRFGGRWFESDAPREPDLPRTTRAGLLLAVLAMYAVIVFSHQLTPFAVLAMVCVLAFVRRLRNWTLPILMAVMLAAWLSYMTVAYLGGHIEQLLQNIGSVETSLSANVTDRFRGSVQHIVVAAVRALTTLFLWGLAAVGFFLRLRAGSRDLTPALLAAVPFGLMLLQSYGGEILLRIYLFSLPFVAFLAASGIAVATRQGARRWTFAIIGTVVVALFAGSFVSRYGNERMDIVSHAEMRGMRALYEIAPRGSTLAALANNVFWQFRDYELYRYRVSTQDLIVEGPESLLARARSGAAGPIYLIVSESQRRALELQYGLSPDEVRELERDIGSLPGAREVFDNTAVVIYRFQSGG